MVRDVSREKLKIKMDELVRYVYKLTHKFPKEKLFGVVSQLRRAVLSVILNYIEEFARRRPNVIYNFWEMSYEPLKS